jgi:succinate dehydrogenase / fumarate reductase, cytochrome b subunit
MSLRSTDRPSYRNIHVTQIISYRLPPAGIVSILHRVTGAALFLCLPLVIWIFDNSIASSEALDGLYAVFSGFSVLPGWCIKLVLLALIWAYLLHFIAGVRHLWMDATHSVTQAQGHSSALATLGLSVGLTVLLGAKLFGMY